MKHREIESFAHQCIVGMAEKAADPRVRDIMLRLLTDLLRAIDELEIQPSEYWAAVDFLEDAAKNDELKLISAGLDLDRFLDLRSDIDEASAGMAGATPRAIEGPLYVAGAPESVGFARMDDGSEEEAQTLFLQGQVTDLNGTPIQGAKVEIWHANAKGNYSYFDKTQSPFNLRRTVLTDEEGCYRVRTIMPKGYSVPEGGYAEKLMALLGRHGHRPAHIHFFVSAGGYRKLTTQINIEGTEHLWDDYAFAEREGLVPRVRYAQERHILEQEGLEKPFASIDFDFRLYQENENAPAAEVTRKRAEG